MAVPIECDQEGIEMRETFIERQAFIASRDRVRETKISISKPKKLDDGFFSCSVKFKDIQKYDTESKGIDEFNSIECAIAYVYSICKNSDDPEFFWTDGQSMRVIE